MSKFTRLRNWLEDFSELRNLLLILFMAGMFTVFNIDRDMPQEEWYRIIRTSELTFTLPEGDSDFNVKRTMLRQGEEVRILGILDRTESCGNGFWVETRSGLRGFIGQAAVDDSVYIFGKTGNPEIPEGATARILSVKYGNYDYAKYNVQLESGVEATVSEDKLVTLTGKKYARYKMKSPTAYMTRETFEKKYLGKTLHEADQVSVPFRFIYVNGGAGPYYIATDVYVFDKETGNIAKANLCFEDGRVTGYSLDGKALRDANRTILSALPLSGAIVSAAPLQWLISKSLYETAVFKDTKRYSGFLGLLLALVFGLVFVVWLANVGVVPLMVALALVRVPAVFYPLPNRWLFVLLAFIGIAGIYIWGVLMLFNNYFWWFVVLLSVAVFIIWLRRIDRRISVRCPGCRHLNTISKVSSNLAGYRYELRDEREVNRILSRRTREWKTWTKVAVPGSWDHVKDIRHHTETTTTKEYNLYKVKYRVNIYDNIFRCRRRSCNYEYATKSESYEVVDKQFTGRQTSTTTTHEIN